jgi:hypothetical protein
MGAALRVSSVSVGGSGRAAMAATSFLAALNICAADAGSQDCPVLDGA